MILENWQIKLSVFLVAVLLWFHVVTEDDYEDTLEIPLIVEENVSQEWIVASTPPQTVSVRVFGQGKRLLRLRGPELKIVLRPTYKGRIKETYSLSPSDVEVPQDIRVMEVINPRAVEVEFDTPLERVLPIKDQLQLKPADGFTQVGPIRLKPDRVTVFGPRRFVSRLKVVYLDSRVLSNVQEDVSLTIPLIVPDGVNISVTPQAVQLEVEVQKIAETEIEGIPASVINVPLGREVRAEPSNIALKVKGGVDLVSSLKPEDFYVSIDYRRVVEEGKEEIEPEIDVPPEIDVVEMKPKTFRVIEAD